MTNTGSLISLCLILRDNPDQIRSFLEDMKTHVDEIVVAIPCSDPVVEETVRRYTDRVFVKSGTQAGEMNLRFAVDQARYAWILALDVLERPDACLKNGLRQLTHSNHDAFLIAVVDVRSDGTVSNRGEYELRLFQKDKVTWPADVKDPRISTGSVGKVDGAYILRRPASKTCADAPKTLQRSALARLEVSLRTGGGEELFDLGLCLERIKREAPVMGMEEALVRFLHGLSGE